MTNCQICIEARFNHGNPERWVSPHLNCTVFQPDLNIDKFYTCGHTIIKILEGYANRSGVNQGESCYNNARHILRNDEDYKVIIYQNRVYKIYPFNLDPYNGPNHTGTVTYIADFQIIDLIQFIDQKHKIDQQEILLTNQSEMITTLETQLAEKDRIIMARTNLNKRLIDTLILYKHKQNESPTYDYIEIKSRKQKLHAEFKRLSKLMKLY